MTTTYRESRNIEASIIDQLQAWFNLDWAGVTVIKGFNRAYNEELPVIAVRVENTTHTPIEIGDHATYRSVQVIIDIFATSDGQRLDLKDYIVGKIKNGISYYTYTTNKGVVKTKTLDGRLNVREILDSPINFETDKNTLDVHDRYRHMLTFNINTGKVEV